MTRKKSVRRMTPAEQSARFIETAKKAQADERPEAMDEAFKKMDLRRNGRAKR